MQGSIFTRSMAALSGNTPTPVRDGRGGGNFLGGTGSFFKTVGLGALSVLDKPRAAVISTLQESKDFIQGKGFSTDDWGRQVGEGIGFGDVFSDPTGNKWLDRVIGFAGDVLLDPLTYVAGAGVYAGTGRAARAGGAARAAAHVTDDVAQSIGRLGYAGIDDATRAVLREAGASTIKPQGYYFKLPGVMSNHIRIPMTAGLDRQISTRFARARARMVDSSVGRRSIGLRPGTTEGMQDAMRTLLTGSGPMPFRQAAGIYMLNNARRLHGRQFTGALNATAQNISRSLKSSDQRAIIHAAEKGADNAVRGFFDAGYKRVTDAGLDLGYRAGYVPHFLSQDAVKWTKDQRGGWHGSPGVKRVIDADAAGTPMFNRSIRKGETVNLFGRDLYIEDDSIAGINAAFKTAFPEVDFNLLDDNFSSVVTRWTHEMEVDVGTVLAAKELANSKLGMFSTSDDIFTPEVNEVIQNKMIKSERAKLIARRQDTAERINSLRNDIATSTADITDDVLDGFDGVIDNLSSIEDEVKQQIKDVSTRMRETTGMRKPADFAKAKDDMERVLDDALGALDDDVTSLNSRIERIRPHAVGENNRWVRVRDELNPEEAAEAFNAEWNTYMSEMARFQVERRALIDLQDRIRMGERAMEIAEDAANNSAIVNAFRTHTDEFGEMADVAPYTVPQSGVTRPIPERLDTEDKVRHAFDVERAETMRSFIPNAARAQEAEQRIALQGRRASRAVRDAERTAKEIEPLVKRETEELDRLTRVKQSLDEQAEELFGDPNARTQLAAMRQEIRRFEVQADAVRQRVEGLEGVAKQAQDEASRQVEMYHAARESFRREALASRASTEQRAALDMRLKELDREEAAMLDGTKRPWGKVYYQPPRVSVTERLSLRSDRIVDADRQFGWGFRDDVRGRLVEIEGELQRLSPAPGKKLRPSQQKRVRELRAERNRLNSEASSRNAMLVDAEYEALADNINKLSGMRGETGEFMPLNSGNYRGLASATAESPFRRGATGAATPASMWATKAGAGVAAGDNRSVVALASDVAEVGNNMFGGSLERSASRATIFDTMVEEGWMTPSDKEFFRRRLESFQELRDEYAKSSSFSRERRLRAETGDLRVQLDFAHRMALGAKVMRELGHSPATVHSDRLASYVMSRALQAEAKRTRGRIATIRKALGNANSTDEMRRYMERTASMQERIASHAELKRMHLEAGDQQAAYRAQQNINRLQKKMNQMESPAWGVYSEIVSSMEESISSAVSAVSEAIDTSASATAVRQGIKTDGEFRAAMRVQAANNRHLARTFSEKSEDMLRLVDEAVSEGRDYIELPVEKLQTFNVDIFDQASIDDVMAMTPPERRDILNDRISKARDRYEREVGRSASGEVISYRVDPSTLGETAPRLEDVAGVDAARRMRSEAAEAASGDKIEWKVSRPTGDVDRIRLDEVEQKIQRAELSAHDAREKVRRSELAEMFTKNPPGTTLSEGEVYEGALQRVLRAAEEGQDINAVRDMLSTRLRGLEANPGPLATRERASDFYITQTSREIIDGMGGFTEADVSELSKVLNDLQGQHAEFRKRTGRQELAEVRAEAEAAKRDFGRAETIGAVLRGERDLSAADIENLENALGAEAGRSAVIVIDLVKDAFESIRATRIREARAAGLPVPDVSDVQLTPSEVLDVMSDLRAALNGDEEGALGGLIEKVFEAQHFDAPQLTPGGPGLAEGMEQGIDISDLYDSEAAQGVSSFTVSRSLADSIESSARAESEYEARSMVGLLAKQLGLDTALVREHASTMVARYADELEALGRQRAALLDEIPNGQDIFHRYRMGGENMPTADEVASITPVFDVDRRINSAQAQIALWKSDQRSVEGGKDILAAIGFNRNTGRIDEARLRRMLATTVGEAGMDASTFLRRRLSDAEVRVGRLNHQTRLLGGEVRDTAGSLDEVLDDTIDWLGGLSDLQAPGDMASQRVSALRTQADEAIDAGDERLYSELVDEIDGLTDGTLPYVEAPPEMVMGGAPRQAEGSLQKLSEDLDATIGELGRIDSEITRLGGDINATRPEAIPKGAATKAEIDAAFERYGQLPDGPERDALLDQIADMRSREFIPKEKIEPEDLAKVRALQRDRAQLSDRRTELESKVSQAKRKGEMEEAFTDDVTAPARLTAADQMGLQEVDSELSQLVDLYRTADPSDPRSARIAARIQKLVERRDALDPRAKKIRVLPGRTAEIMADWRMTMKGLPPRLERLSPGGDWAKGRLLVDEPSYKPFRPTVNRPENQYGRALDDLAGREAARDAARESIEGVGARNAAEVDAMRQQADQLAGGVEPDLPPTLMEAERVDQLRRRMHDRMQELERQRDIAASKQDELRREHTRKLNELDMQLGKITDELDSLRSEQTRIASVRRALKMVERAKAKPPQKGAANSNYVESLVTLVNAKARAGMEVHDYEATMTLLHRAAQDSGQMTLSEADELALREAIDTIAKNPEIAAEAVRDVVKQGWTALRASMVRDNYAEGGRVALKGHTVAINDELNVALDNLTSALKKPASWGIVDKYTSFFKTYATARPGFHIRNGMSAVFMNLVDGVQFKHLRSAPGVWHRFMKDPDKFMRTATQQQRDAVMVVLGSGATGQFLETGSDALVGATSRAYHKLMNNAFTNFNRRAGSYVEGPVRLAMALDSMARGMDRHAALDRVTKFHFDYSEVSRMDQWAKKLIPFWTFMSRNLPLQLEQMWMRPRMYLGFQRLQENFGNEASSYVPSYWMDQGAFTMDENIGPNDSGWYVNFDLPHTRVMDPFVDLGRGDAGAAFLGDVNPLLLTPIESFVAGKRMFSGAPIEGDFQPARISDLPALPILKAIGATRTGGASGDLLVDDRWSHILSGTNPILELAGRLTNTEGTRAGRQGETLARTMGAPVLKLTPEIQASQRRQQQFRERDRREAERQIERS